MRLSISNIAWDISEDFEIAKLLTHFNIDAIDIAPGKYFSDLDNVTDQKIRYVKEWWSGNGIEIFGLQGLLFGTIGLNIFSSSKVQNSMLLHFKKICRIASGLGAKQLTFGSPKNRDRSGLSDENAKNIAVFFFRKLGDIAKDYGVNICIEPVPTCYGSNFMITSAETGEIVKEIAHPAILMQFDTGAITITNEDPEVIIAENAYNIGHIHASEPELLPLGDGNTNHIKIAKKIRQLLPKHVISIETLATQRESHAISIERSLKKAIACYRDEN